MKKTVALLLTTILQAQPNAIWIRTFGGINSDYGRSIQQVFNDGYILIGTTASFSDNNDAWLIKIENPLAEIDDSFIPNIFVFHQNYPNPFNPITLLEYDLPKDELVNIHYL